MKIALAQIDQTIGDLAGNLERIRASMSRAGALGADLVVFPEMATTGYPPHDLLERRSFVAGNLEILDRLAAETGEMAVVVGCVRPADGARDGALLENAAALLHRGRIASFHAKTLLPTYDVFDERRYFSPGGEVSLADLSGRRIGITICEDVWRRDGTRLGVLYDRDPVAELVAAGAEIIVNIAASPFTLEKRTARPALLADVARRHGRPVVFVNQVGGNDDLVFDGHSLALGADGAVLARGRELAEDLVVVDLEAGSGDVRDPLPRDEAAAIEALALGTRDYARKCGFSSAVLGLSGGIDSAVSAAIAARALGPESVLGVAMPSRYSSPGALADAEALARNLGIGFCVIEIDGLFQAFLDALAPAFEGAVPDVTEENIQARCRAVLLMALSNKRGHLLITTGNKSELATGYCTLYGDMAGGLAVLADVPKTLVYRIARELNREREVIPAATISKPPSAELAPDQRDQDSLPAYDVLDAILEAHVDRGLDVPEIVAEGFDEGTVREVARLVCRSEHKRRQAPPGIKITSKAFGPGRRMPMAQRWPG